MGNAILQNKVNLFIMPDGRVEEKGTGLSPMSVDKHSMTGKADGTIPGRGQDYGYDVHGRIRIKNTYQEAPGGLITATIEFDKTVDIDYLEKRRADQTKFGVWEMSSPCGRRDNPFAWLDGGRLDFHGGMTVSGFNGGDSPARDGTATPVVPSAEVTYEYDIILRPLSAESLTPAISTNVTNVNSIFGLKEPLVPGCHPGYLGPDKHLFMVADADTGVPAEVHFSRDGGGTWTPFTNQPFGNDEHISDGAVKMLSGSSPRIIVVNGTGTSALQIAYADLEFGNEAAATWTVVSIDATATSAGGRILWPWYDAVYVSGGSGVATPDDLWLSTDQGETWTQKITGGGDSINAMATGWGQDCEDIYIVGDTNLIQVDRGRSGTFANLVGPSGGGDFSAVAVDNNGVVYAANGTELYVSINKGQNADGWTLLHDFGTSMAVVDIFFPKGDSHHIYVVVDDTTPGTGSVQFSNDAGNSWRSVPTAANGGYNRGYKSEEDDNLYLMVGDVTGGYGVVHRAVPTTSGC